MQKKIYIFWGQNYNKIGLVDCSNDIILYAYYLCISLGSHIMQNLKNWPVFYIIAMRYIGSIQLSSKDL